MKVVDASFLVALFFPRDEHHQTASKTAAVHSNETMLLSDVILFETLTVLSYKIGIAKTQEAFHELQSNPGIVFTYFSQPEQRAILELFFSQDKKLSVADCSVIYLARKHKIDILTFDGEISEKI